MGLYPQFIQQLVLPLYYGIRGRHYARYRRLLEHSQWWSREELLAFQWSQLSPLLDHVFAHVPYYRLKYAVAGIERGDIRTLADFARLPVLTREEIRAHREELRAVNVAQLLPHATGGSSGSPTHFYITRDSYDWRTAATHRAYSWSGVGLGQLTLYLWGAPIGTPPRWKLAKIRTFNALQRQEIVSTFSQSPALWQRIYAWQCRHRPALIVGYVSSLEAYAEYLAAHEGCTASKVCVIPNGVDVDRRAAARCHAAAHRSLARRACFQYLWFARVYVDRRRMQRPLGPASPR